MTALRYGGLLIVGIMILTSCGSRAAKDQPVDQPRRVVPPLKIIRSDDPEWR